jgi:hypothetical protein
MIITSIVAVNKPPSLSLHDDMVKLDFGPVLVEIDVVGFKNLLASMLTQAANQGLDLSTNQEPGRKGSGQLQKRGPTTAPLGPPGEG